MLRQVRAKPVFLTDPATAAIDPDIQSIVPMGRVIGPYGIRGWLKIDPYTSEIDALLDQKTWWFFAAANPRSLQQRKLIQGQVHGAGLVAQISDIGDREQAMAFRGWQVGVFRQALPPLPKGEFYQADLVGWGVNSDTGVELGVVAGWLDNGAHPVMRVRLPTESDKQIERLIPYVPAFVLRLDESRHQIVVSWEPDY